MFTGTSSDNRRVTTHNSRALIKGQSVYMGYSPLHRPVFLVNSRSKQLCVIEDFLFLRPSFSRSYRSILSSSLSRVYSITLVDLLLDHHCRFRVRFIFLCFFLSPSELKMRFNSHSLLINTLSIIRKTQNLFLCSHPIKLSLY
jgi:hypothetical protein